MTNPSSLSYMIEGSQITPRPPYLSNQCKCADYRLVRILQAAVCLSSQTKKFFLSCPSLPSDSPRPGNRKISPTPSNARNSLLYSRVPLVNSWLSPNFSATLSASNLSGQISILCRSASHRQPCQIKFPPEAFPSQRIIYHSAFYIRNLLAKNGGVETRFSF
jgi:hypothetical protein